MTWVLESISRGRLGVSLIRFKITFRASGKTFRREKDGCGTTEWQSLASPTFTLVRPRKKRVVVVGYPFFPKIISVLSNMEIHILLWKMWHSSTMRSWMAFLHDTRSYYMYDDLFSYRPTPPTWWELYQRVLTYHEDEKYTIFFRNILMNNQYC